MKLRDFNNDFGRTFPLAVVKTAYGYVQQGHDAGPAISTASAIFGAKFECRKMRYDGYAVTSGVMETTVYHLQTETSNGLRRMSLYSYPTERGLAITKMGENCLCEPVWQMEHQRGVIVGSYDHCNRYAAVAVLRYDETVELTEKFKARLQKLANVLAMNALAWKSEYEHRLEVAEYRAARKMHHTPVAPWPEFLLQCTLRFVPLVNESCEHYEQLHGTVTVGDYLRNFRLSVDCSLELAEIKVFGL